VQLEGGARYTFSHVKGAYPDSMNRPVAEIEGLNLSSKNNILSGNIKLLYYPSDSWKMSSVTSRGFHAPNIDDMLKVFKKGEIITLPNIHLKPEYSLSQEISITKNIHPNFTVYGVGFYTQLTDAIVKDSILVNAFPDAEDPLWTNQLIYDDEWVYTFSNQNSNKKINLYGGTIGFNAIINGFELNGDFNITRGINANSEASPVAHIPPNFGKLEITKRFDNLRARILLLYSGGKPGDEFDDAGTDNLDETPLIEHLNGVGATWVGLPSWHTINFSLEYKLNNSVTVNFGVDNIMDAHYKTFSSGISAPGRNFIFSGQYSF
jgi:hemoglobin/transferrin/lactoferrin receptor protein